MGTELCSLICTGSPPQDFSWVQVVKCPMRSHCASTKKTSRVVVFNLESRERPQGPWNTQKLCPQVLMHVCQIVASNPASFHLGLRPSASARPMADPALQAGARSRLGFLRKCSPWDFSVRIILKTPRTLWLVPISGIRKSRWRPENLPFHHLPR
jgi:hypothetical protein